MQQAFFSRDFLPAGQSLSVAAEEGTADYAYQLLAIVRGEARDLAGERDKLKGQLETIAAEKANSDITAKAASSALDAEKAQRAALETQLADAREALKAREVAEKVALKKAQDAEERLAQQAREKVAAAANEHGQSEAERDAQERTAAVMQEGSRAIETSATTPATDPAKSATASDPLKPESAPAAIDKLPVNKRSASTTRKQGEQQRSRYMPTYVIEMSDVPWPYAAWHQGYIKRH